MIDDYPVHPAAAVFPMLDADELAALADDILSNGLITPLMLDTAGEILVDGRNRREACRIADVEPVYERLPEGVDPVDYITSVNLGRRHLTKGQQAMALAMLYPQPRRGKRTDLSGDGTSFFISKQRLSVARAVLRVAPDDLAPLVLSGAKSLDEAFGEVQQREQAAKSEDAQLNRLRATAPDLVDLVVEGRLTLAGAAAELDERDRLRQHTINQAHRALAAIATSFAANVDAIIGGLELGEPVRLDPDQSDIIRKSFKLLTARGLLK